MKSTTDAVGLTKSKESPPPKRCCYSLSAEILAILIQLKLNVATTSQFTCRSVHNDLMHCLVILDAIFNSVPLIEEDQKADLLCFLHGPHHLQRRIDLNAEGPHGQTLTMISV